MQINSMTPALISCVESIRPMPADHRPGVSASTRLDYLKKLLTSDGKISTREAADRLSCSQETIRKDLVSMENQGLLRRAHGGALRPASPNQETPIDQRTENLAEKRRIAQAALGELGAGSTVYWESGSTTHKVASLVPEHFALTVFTNSLPIAQTLQALPLIHCHLIGGSLRPLTKATSGYWALRELADLRVDTALLGTNAISDAGELSTPDTEEAAIKAALLSVAKRTVLLADHSKFSQRSIFQYGTLENVDLLITGIDSGNTLVSSLTHRPEATQFV